MNLRNDIVIIAPDQFDWSIKLLGSLDISETTRAEYGARIKFFVEFLQTNSFTKNSYLDYKRYLAKRTDLSVSTKNKYLIVARVYCKELHRQGYIPIDITLNIKSFQQTRKHKKDGFTENEVQQILASVQEKNSSDTCRIRALLSLLILQGLRQVEIVRLNVTEIDLVSQTAFVQGKGMDDTEAIDLHPTTVSALKEYMRHCKVADGPLFTSTSNNSFGRRLATRSLRNLINPILRDLGIDRTLHGFRHFFTTKLIQSYKGDLLTVAQYTRHRSLEMLQVYNDNVKKKADLPKYYETFSGINFTKNEAPTKHNSNYK